MTEAHAGSRRRAKAAVLGAAGAALAHYLPSVCVLGQWAPVPLRALPGGLCRWRGPGDTPEVALTLDDGPSPDSTPRTLALLDDLDMRATFFVTGVQADAHPGLVAEMVRRGHTVGSHGYRHEHHLLRTPRWIAADMAAGADAVARAAGACPRFYRPTYGQLTARTRVEARRHHLELVLWSVWGHEWTEHDAEPVLARLERGLEPGAIVLLHDNEVQCPPGTAEVTHRTLELLAGSLARHGLRAVTLDQLLDGRPPLRLVPEAQAG